MNDDERSAVEAVHAALAAKDGPGLRLLLHPYLHWTDPTGRHLRGRTKVLEYLADAGHLAGPPASVEVRDGQIYRWTA